MTLGSTSHPLSGSLVADPYATHVAARLLEFLADATPWPRRLWDISSVLALREAHELGRWQAQNVISAGAVAWYLPALERQLGPDRGLGDSKLRRHITTLLRSRLEPDSPERRQLAQLLPTIESSYLDRWHDAVCCGDLPSHERIARAIATHLLDQGHSSGQLHRWARKLVSEPHATLGNLLDAACALAKAPDNDYEVLVPFQSVPDHQRLAAHLSEWRTATQTAAWFRTNEVTNPPRQYGGFLFTIAAKDPIAASRIAGARVQRLQARASYARGDSGRLKPIGSVWIAGQPPRSVVSPARGVEVLSLVRERTMYCASGQDQLDEALELAAPLNAGPPAPAVSGGWSAIESLLSTATDTGPDKPGRVVAADRLAAIVTCSWPRAELTSLSYRHHPHQPDDLSERLNNTTQNLDRCLLVAAALADGRPLATDHPRHAAAATRMTNVLADPHRQLADVRAVFQNVLRRLYRQRNIAVHGGTAAGSVALEATLRTAAPLVGAGLDRLVHAKLVTGVAPLELAARAANSLELVDDASGPGVTTMLERPPAG